MSDITIFHIPQRGAFNQEDGEAVVHVEGRRVVR